MTAAPAVRLGDVATIERDMIAPEDIRSGTQYVGLEHVESSGRFLGVREVDAGDLASTKFAFNPSHVLYGKLRPYLCKIARPDFSGVCTTEIVPIKPGAKLDRDYLYHFLRLPRMVEFATSRCSGANLPRLSPKMLADFEIPLPPLAEQKRIAAVLDKADDLRAKRRHALATLDTLLQSVFLDMFGNEPDAKKVPLGAVADVIDCKHRTPKYVDDGIPVVRPRNVKEAGIDLDSCIRTTREEYLDLVENRVPTPGDIVYSRNASFGVASRVATKEPFAIGQDVCLIVPTKINSTFLWYQLNSHFVRRQLDGVMSGSTFKRVNLKAIRKLEVSVLQQDSQQRFEAEMDRVDELRLGMQQAGSELDALFASVQSAAFAGTLFDDKPPDAKSAAGGASRTRVAAV